VAGGEGEAVVALVLQDLDGGRRHDLLLFHHVGELALDGLHRDLVTRDQLVDPVERRAIGGAVTGDGRVPLLTGERGLRVVPRPLLEVGQGHALDDDLVHADGRDADVRRRLPLVDRRDRRSRHRLARQGARRGGRSRGGLLQRGGEVVLEAVLCLGLPDPGAPQLVGHEEQDQHADGDAGATDRTEEPRQTHPGTLPTALVALVASEGRP
jgi:hypothetical protein